MDHIRLLRYALLNNDIVVNSLAKTDEGYPLVTEIRSPNAKYPLITINIIGGGDVKFADYEPYLERTAIEIDLYGTVEYEVEEEIKKVINELGYFLIHKGSNKNLYSGIKHTVYHISQVMTKELFNKRMVEQERIYNEKYQDDIRLPDGQYFDNTSGEKYVMENNIRTEIETIGSNEIDPSKILKL